MYSRIHCPLSSSPLVTKYTTFCLFILTMATDLYSIVNRFVHAHSNITYWLDDPAKHHSTFNQLQLYSRIHCSMSNSPLVLEVLAVLGCLLVLQNQAVPRSPVDQDLLSPHSSPCLLGHLCLHEHPLDQPLPARNVSMSQ